MPIHVARLHDIFYIVGEELTLLSINMSRVQNGMHELHSRD